MLDKGDSDQMDAFADGIGSCLSSVLCGNTNIAITIISTEAETFPAKCPAKAEYTLKDRKFCPCTEI